MSGRNPIHICHITQSPGGVETFILNIIKNTNSNLFKHVVLCYKNGNLYKRAEEYGASVILIPMTREISIIKDLKSFVKIILYLKKNPPDVIHGHSAKGGVFSVLSGWLLNIPSIYTPHAFSYLSQVRIKRKIALKIEKFLTLFNSYFLPSGEAERDRAIMEVGWRKKDILNIYYNSISLNRYTNNVNNNKKKVITTLARLTYQKNPLMFVNIAKNVLMNRDDVVFLIVGVGMGYTDELTESTKQFILLNGLEEKIILKPWSSENEIEEILDQTDIYFSTSRFEGLPTVLLMAYNHEIPIVATNVDGNKDVVKHGITGYLSNDEKELENYLNILLTNSDLKVTLGQNGRTLLAEKFNIEKNIRVLEKSYYLLSSATLM